MRNDPFPTEAHHVGNGDGEFGSLSAYSLEMLKNVFRFSRRTSPVTIYSLRFLVLVRDTRIASS